MLLPLAIQEYFNVKPNVAKNLASAVKIFHPYGDLGELKLIPFGSNETGSNLISIADRIKTFTEGMDSDESLKSIRDSISLASKVVFLGFAYHPMNLDLICPFNNDLAGAPEIIGTGYGMSNLDLKTVSDSLFTRFNHVHQPIIFNGDCNTFYKEYWHALSFPTPN